MLYLLYFVLKDILKRDKLLTLSDAPERRCSSRTFRYGYLVTT